MKISGIYKIQSQIEPDRYYIGSAINIKARWGLHLIKLRQNKHHSIKLQNHYNKYGESDLFFIIIEPCFSEFLTIREQFYLDSLNPYFNICKIANSVLGIKKTPEQCKRSGLSKIGLKRTDEQRKKMSDAHKGKKITEEHKNNISKSNIGKHSMPKSEETKRNIGLGSRGNHYVLGKHWKLSKEQCKYRSECMKIIWNKRKTA